MTNIQPQKMYNVVVVGGGLAGLMTYLCLTTYGFNILHIDERAYPTTAGRADGIQPRTIEAVSIELATFFPPISRASLASVFKQRQGLPVDEAALAQAKSELPAIT
ncbi:hypothetical protein B0H17DRAFT_1339146 [Mycena rosella]|uniref:FAD-binding domain-containing protein n=1 Tax=Mycena rosella TaxID=1033263 RepID=A0AAD7FXP8_MYCRO|nr:hypothetical protein B0H17DRAFT_1341644 [Mycena rosella]KAJ7643223.1 hypothetical protein B0H17DRAFT_1339146 [Mycena rosella]